MKVALAGILNKMNHFVKINKFGEALTVAPLLSKNIIPAGTPPPGSGSYFKRALFQTAPHQVPF